MRSERMDWKPVERGPPTSGRVFAREWCDALILSTERSQIDSLQLERGLTLSGTGVPGNHLKSRHHPLFPLRGDAWSRVACWHGQGADHRYVRSG